MKNILLGIIGSLILLNTTCICLQLLKYSACVNEREQALSQQLLEYTEGHWSIKAERE